VFDGNQRKQFYFPIGMRKGKDLRAHHYHKIFFAKESLYRAKKNRQKIYFYGNAESSGYKIRIFGIISGRFLVK